LQASEEVFPGPNKSQAQIEAESDAEISQRHKAKWAGGFNDPLDPHTIQAKTLEKVPRTSVLASIIDLFDTTPGEVAYWERKPARQESPQNMSKNYAIYDGFPILNGV
jgi:hypothetical protein